MINNINKYLDTLEERERKILGIGIAFVFLYILFNFMVIPFFDYKKKLETGIASSAEQINDIKNLGAKYKKLTGQKRIVNLGSQSIALFSFIDSLAGKTGVKDNIDYMKPSKESLENYTIEKVEVKISNIDMKSLISFIYEIESSKGNINIKGLTIKKSDKGDLIDSTIQAEIIKNNA